MKIEQLDAKPRDPRDVLPYPRCQEQIEERRMEGKMVAVGKCTRRADHGAYDEWHWTVYVDPVSHVPTYYRFRL